MIKRFHAKKKTEDAEQSKRFLQRQSSSQYQKTHELAAHGFMAQNFSF